MRLCALTLAIVPYWGGDQIDAITRTVGWFDKYLHPAQTETQTQ